MEKYNSSLYELENGNGFSNVNSKIIAFRKNNPNVHIISLGIGDVSKPIIPPILEALHEAVDEMGNIDTFQGYGSYYGNENLRKVILDNEYKQYGFTVDEIYISNGTKTDSTSILELFNPDSKIFITDPGYSVYRDGALCLNRVTVAEQLSEETDFIPQILKEKYDIVYLCSPNNPIGNAYSYETLEKWIAYALENNAIILYDNVYFPFIKNNNLPLSIYDIKDAEKVSIEFRSFSKAASFSGLRCSYYIIPNQIGDDVNKLWKKRTMNRTNGVDYIVQKGAIASYSKSAKTELKKNIDGYLANAQKLKLCFEKIGLKVWGGTDSPFMWVKNPKDISSWEYFDFMLNELNIIIIPGVVFGKYGEGYFRVSALGSTSDINIAIERINNHYENKI